MDIELFKQRLIESATWCQGYSRAEDRLRSPVLQPALPSDATAYYHGSVDLYYLRNAETRVRIIDDVVKRRTTLLQSQKAQKLSLSEVARTGRLLVYAFYQTLCDGAAEVETDGFYDLGDAPPWDTWVYRAEDQLICWIPQDYVHTAHEGAQVPCGQCLYWLDELDTDLTHQLRAAGLLPNT